MGLSENISVKPLFSAERTISYTFGVEIYTIFHNDIPQFKHIAISSWFYTQTGNIDIHSMCVLLLFVNTSFEFTWYQMIYYHASHL